MASELNIDPAYVDLLASLHLNADSIFSDPRIRVWRSLPDRENATLDFQQTDGTVGRLHIKRYPTSAGSMAERELAGYQLLKAADIPAAPIIASVRRSDGSSAILLEDLRGYTPADKWIKNSEDFAHLLTATADLAALLHDRRLHHRDLYLCHFMVKRDAGKIDAKLIDMARVSRLQSPLTRRRWIVKDLAQFWYSTQSLPITDAQRRDWLDHYCQKRQISAARLIRSIQRKAHTIAKHDQQLRRKQPGRNVSVNPASTP
jgi:hypothetical protein